MIYTTCLRCYATFSWRGSTIFRVLLAVGLLALSIFITLYYYYLKDPVFHQNAYAILTATVFARAVWTMETILRPNLREEHARITSAKILNSDNALDQTQPNPLSDDKIILGRMWMLIGMGLSIFLAGFAIWALENRFCSDLRRLRRDVGLPWGIVLEGHGWW